MQILGPLLGPTQSESLGVLPAICGLTAQPLGWFCCRFHLEKHRIRKLLLRLRCAAQIAWGSCWNADSDSTRKWHEIVHSPHAPRCYRCCWSRVPTLSSRELADLPASLMTSKLSWVLVFTRSWAWRKQQNLMAELAHTTKFWIQSKILG